MLLGNFMFLLLVFRTFSAPNWPSTLKRVSIIVIQLFVSVLSFQIITKIENILHHVCLFSWRYNPLWLYFSQPGSVLYPPRFRGFLIKHNDAPQLVGFLWTSDQSVAETSTWQHTTFTTDKHPCPRWDSNPQSQQASVQRPTP